MSKQNGNMGIKIFRSIFAAVNLALISGGLVSCVVEVPQPSAPTEQQKPRVIEPIQQPKQKDKDDDDDKNSDRKNDKHDEKDEKDDND
ncbi:hypothetical protein [Nostoc sp. TCL240-02]|uniref:hypothetical protein n=1 Tax=Nostoc sp. TCL240-02 TaxID=2572090 RepID=UPI00157F8F81|nr:hypothetical protein [Nostoc sp. TCL240-02]QKQ76135.1 hypothetical protein FBB35_25150 [Nostoc sp. TCL240-02]